MKRETVEIGLEDAYESRPIGFKWISQKEVYTDLEKGYEDIEVIFQREEDGKFFKVKYSIAPGHSITSDGLCNDDPLIATEVFPKTKTITVYE